LIVQESYLYDPNGNLNQFTDRKSQVTKYQYDGINRRSFTGFGWNGSTYQSTINYSWDGGDRLQQAVDSVNGTITRTYDLLDRLTQEQTPLGTVGYQFDNANRRCLMAVTPTGTGQTTVNYSYVWDSANRLGNIYLGSNGCSSTGTAAVGITYDSSNRRQQLTLPNGVTVAYGYDVDSRVNGLTYSVGFTQLGTLSYTYDDAGRRLTTYGTLAAGRCRRTWRAGAARPTTPIMSRPPSTGRPSASTPTAI
jgi:uncharacterized protein RhaS with RHS repeats